jgi:uridine phosphorylase
MNPAISLHHRCGMPYAVHADAELISRFSDIEELDENHIEVDPATGLAVYSPPPPPAAPAAASAVTAEGSGGENAQVDASKVIIHRGMTLSAVGFYGPQGREVRLPLERPELNTRIESFCYEGKRVTNYEMEGATLAGMAALLGHKAVTICTIVANRFVKSALPNYKHAMDNLIVTVLDRI